MKVWTNCPSCLQSLKLYADDLTTGLLEADCTMVEMARLMLGEDWLPDYLAKANRGD